MRRCCSARGYRLRRPPDRRRAPLRSSASHAPGRHHRPRSRAAADPAPMPPAAHSEARFGRQKRSVGEGAGEDRRSVLCCQQHPPDRRGRSSDRDQDAEGSETEDVLPNFLIELVICALSVSTRLEAPAHFCAPLASEGRNGSGRRA